MVNLVLALFFLLISNGASAEGGGPFDELWSEIYQKSYSIQAAQSDEQAAQVSKSRADLHWLPSLSLSASAISTNDPSTVLFSNLSARSVQSSDFAPSSLNSPDRQWFGRGTLSLNWPLFEGGSKLHFSNAKALESQGMSAKYKADLREEYVLVVRKYAKLTSLRVEQKNLQSLEEIALVHAKNYRLNSSDNPLGYSGSLGLRMLVNRVEGALDQVASEINSLEIWLNTKRRQEDAVIETPLSYRTFVETAFSKREFASGENLKIQSMNLQSQAREEYASAEKSRYLPHVGLFGNENLTSGSRDTGTSTEYGVYLKWELFNVSNFGVGKESQFTADAFKYRTRVADEEAHAGSAALVKTIPILKRNLDRAYESLELSLEQAKVTERLFKRGTVNALQLSEVLSRRADTISATHELEMAYLENLAEQFLLQGEGL